MPIVSGNKSRGFDQLAFYRLHDSFRCLIRVQINCPLETVDWAYDVREGHHGEVVACKQLADRPLVGLADELQLAWQELGLDLQEQLYPCGPVGRDGDGYRLGHIFPSGDPWLGSAR